MTAHFFRNADGMFVVFDVTSLQSFENISRWWKATRAHNDLVPITVFGTKTDLAAERKVTPEMAVERCQNLGVQYREGSAKTGDGVREAFTEMVPSMLLHKKSRIKDSNSAVKLGATQTLDAMGAAKPAAKRGCALL